MVAMEYPKPLVAMAMIAEHLRVAVWGRTWDGSMSHVAWRSRFRVPSRWIWTWDGSQIDWECHAC